VGYLGHFLISRSVGQGQGHMSKKAWSQAKGNLVFIIFYNMYSLIFFSL